MSGTPVHVRKEQSQNEGAGGDWDEEQRKWESRDFGTPLPNGRNEGFPAGSVFDASIHPRNSAGEGNGNEFNSPRGGDEGIRRQSNERGDKSTDEARSLSPRREGMP